MPSAEYIWGTAQTDYRAHDFLFGAGAALVARFSGMVDSHHYYIGEGQEADGVAPISTGHPSN